jgi:superfamily II DNA/RNA helicase
VIVATTGRLLDHLKNTKGFSLEDVEVLVLDEADRLLEMGFKDQLKEIIAACKNTKR